MAEELADLLKRHPSTYPSSIRRLDDGTHVFVARRGTGKLVGLTRQDDLQLLPLTWENYERLRAILPITPMPCNRQASFGTGDRLGMVSAAHLSVLMRYPVFPVIVQQSPRELIKTGRSFKDVLLDAVMGFLECGCTGPFGADADHIKDEARLMEAVEAGYSMYTLDVSDWLGNASDPNPLSRKIVSEHAGRSIAIHTGGRFALSEQGLHESALIYQEAMERVKHLSGLIRQSITDFDLEVSVDEGSRETTPEDHLFVAEYLHRSEIDFTSLAPKFPGKFHKGVDYEGDVDLLAESLHRHAALCRMLGGYRLSLHSGSDKFSIYPLFREATEGHFHVKTSGTSWLQAVKVISEVNEPLFRDLYALCLANLEESRKAYRISITSEQFPAELPSDIGTFFQRPDVRQLLHISYGVLLDERRADIRRTLEKHEEAHYSSVYEHIARHLEMLL